MFVLFSPSPATLPCVPVAGMTKYSQVIVPHVSPDAIFVLASQFHQVGVDEFGDEVWTRHWQLFSARDVLPDSWVKVYASGSVNTFWDHDLVNAVSNELSRLRQWPYEVSPRLDTFTLSQAAARLAQRVEFRIPKVHPSALEHPPSSHSGSSGHTGWEVPERWEHALAKVGEDVTHAQGSGWWRFDVPLGPITGHAAGPLHLSAIIKAPTAPEANAELLFSHLTLYKTAAESPNNQGWAEFINPTGGWGMGLGNHNPNARPLGFSQLATFDSWDTSPVASSQNIAPSWGENPRPPAVTAPSKRPSAVPQTQFPTLPPRLAPLSGPTL